MNQKQSTNDQLNLTIRFLKYEGPLFIRINSDLESDLQKGGSLVGVTDTI
ncbi:MAG: hypothetical protein ACFFB5_05950 [Promethearchaeota archaeon]